MPPRELSGETLDADNPRAEDAQIPTPVAQADEVAQAEARAEAARARAARLRELAEAASSDQGGVDYADDADNERDPGVTAEVDTEEDTEEDRTDAAVSRRSLLLGLF